MNRYVILGFIPAATLVMILLTPASSSTTIDDVDYTRCLHKGSMADYSLMNRSEYTQVEMLDFVQSKTPAALTSESILDTQRIVRDVYRLNTNGSYRLKSDLTTVVTLIKREVSRCLISKY